MTRNSHSILILTSILIIIGSSACNHRTTGVSKSITATTPEKPLPDITTMVNRMIRQDGCKNFIAVMRLTIEGQRGGNNQVDFRIQRKYSDEGAMTFLNILAPINETDKAFLAIEKTGRPTQALSYLPGLKKLTRLNSAKQLGIGGAKVTVQELLGMELNQYSHNTSKRVAEKNEQMIKVEFREKPALGLAYPQIIGYFHEEEQQPARFEIYDASDELQKRVTIEKIKSIDGRQTITKLAINDLAQQRTIKLETRKIEFNRDLPDSIFTENYLKSFIDDASRKLDQVN
jgi:outer membrane lipoprotein-sorting protein